MIKKAIFNILFVLTFVFGIHYFPGQARADDSIISDLDSALLELVNLSRNDPVLIAKALDLAPESLFAQIPDHSSFWDRNKPDLYFDLSLQEAARDYIDDIVRFDVYPPSEASLPSLRERAEIFGYTPDIFFGYSSLVTITNYMDADKALINLYRQFFLDQVESFISKEPSIFDYGLKGAGLALVPARLTLAREKRNVYIFVSSFGRSAENNIESEIYYLVNSFRKNPESIFRVLGVNQEQAEQYLGDTSYVPRAEVVPLVNRPVLSRLDPETDRLDTEDGSSPEFLQWSTTAPVGLDANMTARFLLQTLFYEHPDSFVRLVFDAYADTLDLIVKSSINDQHEGVYEVFSVRYKTEDSQKKIFWLGRIILENFSGQSVDTDIFRDFLVVLECAKGETITIAGVDNSGLFKVNLPFGSYSWRVISDDNHVAAGRIFAFKNLWEDIAVSTDSLPKKEE